MPLPFNWIPLRAALEQLQHAPLTPESAAVYVLELDQLEAAVYEQQSSLSRAYYTDPTNSDARAALVAFYEEVQPRAAALVKACAARLSVVQDALPQSWLPTLIPFINTGGDEYVTAALSRIQSEAERFGAISATVSYEYPDGEGDLLADRGSPDRAVRERAHLVMLDAERHAAKEKVELFVQLHAMRQDVARSAGYATYTDFAWSRPPLTERDYTRQDVAALREHMRNLFPPVLRRLNEIRRQTVGGARPWDQTLSLDGQLHRSFIKDPQEALDAVQRIMDDLSVELSGAFRALRAGGTLHVAGPDDDYRQPITNFLPVSGLPWVSCWYSSVPTSVFTLLHEVGHALHLYRMPKDALFRQHYPAKEYMEFVAQATETVSMLHMDHFYDQAALPAVQLSLIERALKTIITMTVLDEFQERAYALDVVTEPQLNALYHETLSRFMSGEDCEGLEELIAREWATWHVIVHPFYNIEYVLAWIGALAWMGRDDGGHLLERATARHQDAPTGVLFSSLGLQIHPGMDELQAIRDRMVEVVENCLNQLHVRSIVTTS